MDNSRKIDSKSTNFISKLFRINSFGPSAYTVKNLINDIKKVIQDLIKKIQQNLKYIIINQNQIEGMTAVCFLQDLYQIFQVKNELQLKNLRILAQKINQKPINFINTIKSEANRNGSIINQILQLWQKYIKKKYTNISNKSQIQTLKTEVFADIKMGINLFTNIFITIFQNWIQVDQISKNYLKIRNWVIPQIITQHKDWKQNQQIICKFLSQKIIQLKLNKKPQFFEIDKKYNCNSSLIQFFNTMNQIKLFCHEHKITKKLEQFKKISQILKQQIQNHQQKLIFLKQLKSFQLIDVDNIVACLQFSILMSNQPYFLQHLYLLQAFYDQQFMSKNNIAYLFACCESASQMLYNLKQPSFDLKKQNNINNENDIQLIKIQFQNQFKFSNCFQYFGKNRIECIQPCWVSVFSKQKISSKCQIRIKIQKNIQFIMIGLIFQQGLKLNEKYLIENQHSICLSAKNGDIYKQGAIIKNTQDYFQPSLILMKLNQTSIEWYFDKNFFPKKQYIQLKKKKIYFHLILNYGAEIIVL